MKKEIIKVELKNGLEATPAAMLVQVASTYDSKIYLQSEDGTVKVNAKSIMGMMSMVTTRMPLWKALHST